MKKVPNCGNVWVTVAVLIGQVVVEKLIEYYLESAKKIRREL